MNKQFESYILNYSKRHNFAAHQVKSNDLLHQCAIVERQVGVGVLTLPEARRIITELFPQTNCITGIYSVLDLVKPYDGCWRELKDQDWRYRWTEKGANA